MKKIIIIGAGLSGLMASLLIKKNIKNTDVTIIEKGSSYILRTNSSTDMDYLCGVGGAGTVSGGKLCMPPASSGIWKKSEYSFERFAKFFDGCLRPFLDGDYNCKDIVSSEVVDIKSKILHKEYETLLLNKTEMNRFVTEILNELKRNGVNLIDCCEVKEVNRSDDGFCVKCFDNKSYTFFNEKCDYVIIASGRSSAFDIKRWMPKFVSIVPQCPDLGIRISAKRSKDGAFNKIGKDVKLKATIDNIQVRTFCVCSGGDKVILDFHGAKYYDGHFLDKITDTVNFGILARSPHICGSENAIAYCKYLERYMFLNITLYDFLKIYDELIEKTSKFYSVFKSIAYFVQLIKENGFLSGSLKDYQVWLPSIDNLSPKININNEFKVVGQENMFVIGDATGLSRGFVQAMWSSYCVTEALGERVEGCSFGEARTVLYE